jgi:hypothetical protein
MARPSTAIEFREPGPPKSASQGAWLPTLTPLLKHKGRWAMVKEFDSPVKAHDTAGNLRKRKVRIPEPTHDWGFAARGCELFAIYRGPTRPQRTRAKTKRS